MRPKSLMLLILALGCGLVAAVGINQVLAHRDTQVVVHQGETEPIFVAMTDIALGEPLTPQVVKLEQWPKDKVPAGAMRSLAEIEGRRTRTKVYAGEPILDAKLLSADASKQGATALIPPGFRVVSVKVDAVSGGSSLILPGDRVDVMVYLLQADGRGGRNVSTRTVLQDVRVFAVNDRYRPTPQEQLEDSILARTISLLVTPEQAELLTLASEMGKLRLSMRSPEDDHQVATGGARATDLLGGAKADRDAEKLYDDKAEDAADPLLALLDQQPKKEVEEKKPEKKPIPVTLIDADKMWTMLVLEGKDARQVDFYDDGQTIVSRPMIGGLPGAKMAAPATEVDDFDLPDQDAGTDEDFEERAIRSGPLLEDASDFNEDVDDNSDDVDRELDNSDIDSDVDTGRGGADNDNWLPDGDWLPLDEHDWKTE